MYIIKLGGSVITDKTKENCFKQKIADDLVRQIKKSKKETIIIHGAGSFGHIIADKYKLNEGHISVDQLIGLSLTQGMVQKLNSLVLDSLHNIGIPGVSIPPHSCLILKNHKPFSFNHIIFKDYLDNGFTPVTFGDVVLDKQLGFSICSGDLLMLLLAENLKPEKTIFVIDEDGIYTSNPKQDINAELIESTTIDQIDEYITSRDKHTDVTGGMQGKISTIKKIAKLGTDTILLNGNKPDRLFKVLIGEKTRCTNISGGHK
ncbi:MAG: isopentenyl phosphate kinase family protein [Thermoplasmatales archaeon]|nr:MAG: isopentenyl phosphate kinase family protein [Thermoplasmatales archaeon]